jgi:hypothetical protein
MTMAKNWKDIDFKAIADDSAKKTDAALASQISSLTTLTDADVKKLFPEKADVAKFIELMTIVKSADDKNKKIKQIMANTEKFAGIIVTVLGKII